MTQLQPKRMEQAEPKAAPKFEAQVHPRRMEQAEYGRVVYRVIPEAGTPMDALLDPAYWAHVAQMLKPYYKLEVVPEDGAWYAELLVVSTMRLAAKVMVLFYTEIKENSPDVTDMEDLEVKFRGPRAKYCVIRKSDKKVLMEELSTREAATEWAVQYQRQAA